MSRVSDSVSYIASIILAVSNLSDFERKKAGGDSAGFVVADHAKFKAVRLQLLL